MQTKQETLQKKWWQKIPFWPFSGLITSILTACVFQFIIPRYFPAQVPKVCVSNYCIEGKWKIENKENKIIGEAQIVQINNSCEFTITGEFYQPIRNQSNVNFHSIITRIKDNEIYFFYENNFGEKGICQGDFKDLSKKPNKIYFNYTDLINYDKNKDPNGTMVFNKINIQE